MQCSIHLGNPMSLDLEFLVSYIGEGVQSCVFVGLECVDYYLVYKVVMSCYEESFDTFV